MPSLTQRDIRQHTCRGIAGIILAHAEDKPGAQVVEIPGRAQLGTPEVEGGLVEQFHGAEAGAEQVRRLIRQSGAGHGGEYKQGETQ